MRVLFTSTQGEGHVRPLLPYARAMKARGHDVLIAAPENCAAIAAKAGLAHVPFERLGSDELQAIWAPHRGLRDDEMLAIALPQMFAGPTARTSMSGLQKILADWQPDVLIRESVEYAGLVLARAHGIPHARVNVHNCWFESRINHFAEEPVNILLDEAGLKQEANETIWNEPVFTSFPDAIDGDAPQGEANPPFRIRSDAGVPMPDTDWHPKGDRPLIYATFGTVTGGSDEQSQTFQMVLDALAELDVEVLLTVGPDFDIGQIGSVPRNATVRPFVPQAAVFPHASAILCHGGSGTLLGGIAAGLPQVVVPRIADQWDNARRTESAGLGVQVLDPTVSALSAAITGALEDTGILQTCRRIADEMSKQAVIDEAADRIETMA